MVSLGNSARSMSATRCPRRARSVASDAPAQRAPTMTTSYIVDQPRRAALPDRLPGCERLDVGGRKGVAGDAPVSTLDLLDDDPRHRTQGLAFDVHHRVGEPADHVALLALIEHAFDHLDVYQGHRGHLLNSTTDRSLVVAQHSTTVRAIQGLCRLKPHGVTPPSKGSSRSRRRLRALRVSKG